MTLALQDGPRFDLAPYRLSGTVYGVLLNHRAALLALGEVVDKPPYKAAPKSVRNCTPGYAAWTRCRR